MLLVGFDDCERRGRNSERNQPNGVECLLFPDMDAYFLLEFHA